MCSRGEFLAEEKSATRRCRRDVMRLLRRLTRTRYDVQILSGPKELTGPTLVLPNHPTYVDPGLLLCHLPNGDSLRPLVYTETYRHFAMRPLMKFFHALEVPEMRRNRRTARAQMLDVRRDVVAGLNVGEKFLVYPSGRLQRNGQEWIGPASAAHDIVQAAPHGTQVVLVRSRGAWGSLFSCANRGAVPSLTWSLIRSLGYLVLNGILWMPKRKVEVVMEVRDVAELRLLSRVEFNAMLEAWYNVDGAEVLSLVPYHRWFGTRPRRMSFNGVDVAESESNAMVRLSSPRDWRARTVSASRRFRSAAGRLRRLRRRDVNRSRSTTQKGTP